MEIRRIVQITTLIILATIVAGQALAQDMYVYPTRGQSQQQMERDKYECYTWARGQTGFDPMAAPQATSAPPSQGAPRGGVFRGAARVAALGAVGGAIAGDAGKGAAIGAATGGLFGGMGGRQRRRGYDLEAAVEIALSEAAEGTDRTLEFRRNDICDRCDGSGAEPGTRRITCTTCGGYGQVERAGGLGGIFGRVVTACPTCRGRGSVPQASCKQCRGQGRHPVDRTVAFKVPPGIEDGQPVRIRE